MHSLANLPNFIAYFAASAVLLAGFLALYTWITPLHEWELIRQGNRAAALSLGGAMVGFAMPLATAIAHSNSFLDMLVWSIVSLIVQLACFGAMRLLRHDPSGGIANDDMAEATLLAASAVVIGLLNAACLT